MTDNFTLPAPHSQLRTAFDATDSFSYGQFRIEKPVGKPIEDAVFYAGGFEVKLGAEQKRIMLLLIAQQGELVTIDLINAMREEAKPANPKLINVHICHIRKAIKLALEQKGISQDDITKINNSITSLNPARGKGQSGDFAKTTLKAAYRISPSP